VSADGPNGDRSLTRGAGAAAVGADRPRLLVVEGLQLTTPADPYFTLHALATYCSHSVRWLRDRLRDPEHPLPYFQPPGGRILVRRSEFDAWIAVYRHRPDVEVSAIVADVLGRLSA
jgi:hypothetical protein